MISKCVSLYVCICNTIQCDNTQDAISAYVLMRDLVQTLLLSCMCVCVCCHCRSRPGADDGLHVCVCVLRSLWLPWFLSLSPPPSHSPLPLFLLSLLRFTPVSRLTQAPPPSRTCNSTLLRVQGSHFNPSQGLLYPRVIDFELQRRVRSSWLILNLEFRLKVRVKTRLALI